MGKIAGSLDHGEYNMMSLGQREVYPSNIENITYCYSREFTGAHRNTPLWKIRSHITCDMIM